MLSKSSNCKYRGVLVFADSVYANNLNTLKIMRQVSQRFPQVLGPQIVVFCPLKYIYNVRTIKTSNFVNIKCRLVYKSDPAKKVQGKKIVILYFLFLGHSLGEKVVAENEKGKKIWIFLKHKHLIFGYVVNSDNAILFSKKTRYIFHYSTYIISLELRFHL